MHSKMISNRLIVSSRFAHRDDFCCTRQLGDQQTHDLVEPKGFVDRFQKAHNEDVQQYEHGHEWSEPSQAVSSSGESTKLEVMKESVNGPHYSTGFGIPIGFTTE